jgi:hypothetical protein
VCDELDREPDAARRPAPSAGHADINRRLTLWRGLTRRLSETVTPLFPAPPDVCRALGKTILFGVIPLASAEISEAPPAGSTVFSNADVEEHLSPYFKKSSSPRGIPRREMLLTANDADDPALKPWINMLRQVMLELDAFGESAESAQSASAESKAVFAALQRIKVPLVRRHPAFPNLPYLQEYEHLWPTRPAGDLLREHANVLVTRNPGTVQMPGRWPRVSESVANELFFAAKRSLETRLTTLLRPREPRFDQRSRLSRKQRTKLGLGQLPAAVRPETGDMYRLRAFVRVRHHEHCPPHLVWSDYSEPFTIAPWYEGTGAPPVQVSLPDPTDRDFLKRLRPNVAFTVPGSLFNLITNTDPKDLLAGKGSSAPSQPGWVCGFNIPIITICAFVLLSIMLIVLNMIFFWLPFVKICFPVPRLGAPRPS